MQGTGILFSEMTPPPGREAEFHAWYDEEHIPLRMAVPGFLSGQRYGVDGGFLAVYEMTDLSALATPAYDVVKNQPSDRTRDMLANVSGFTRYLGQEMSVQRKPELGGRALLAPLLYSVFFNVPEDRLAEFDAWYEQDHVPLLMESPDWWMVRRFAITVADPVPFNRLALHYLGSMDAMTSPAREKARNTPWRAKLAAEPWFKGVYKVFNQHGPRQTGRVA
jgi:hypothetical protein